MVTTMSAMHGVERRCWSCKLSYRYPPGMTRFACEACREINEVVPANAQVGEHTRQPDMQLHTDGSVRLGYGKRSVHAGDHGNAGEQLAPIDTTKVLATLNGMSSDKLRQLHDQLAIILLVEDANRTRHEDTTSFATVRRILSNHGV